MIGRGSHRSEVLDGIESMYIQFSIQYYKTFYGETYCTEVMSLPFESSYIIKPVISFNFFVFRIPKPQKQGAV